MARRLADRVLALLALLGKVQRMRLGISVGISGRPAFVDRIISIAQGGTSPTLGPLEDGDTVLSGLSAGATELSNYQTSAPGASIVELDAAATINGAAPVRLNPSLELMPDYWIDATNGNDANAGTTEGAAWASLNKIEGITGAVGEDTVIRVKSGTYNTTNDHLEINGFDGRLVIVFEPGCVMDGTAHGETAQNPIYAGNSSTVMLIYGNGLSVQNYSGLNNGTPNGIGWGGSGTTVTAHNVTLSNCSDGLSGHNNGHGIFYDCTVLGDHNKSTIANVGGSTMDAYRCEFTANDDASGGYVLSDSGFQYFEDCIFTPSALTGNIQGEHQHFKRCQLGTLSLSVIVEGRTNFSPATSILIEDGYIHLQQQASARYKISSCYGRLSVRVRDAVGDPFEVMNCVISAPAVNFSSIIYSNFDAGGSVQSVFTNNIFETATAAAFMSVDSINAGYVVSANSKFHNNILSGSAAFDADLTAADTEGTVIVDNVTADALIGAANTLASDDYGYAAGSPAIGAATDGGNSGFAVGEVSAPQPQKSVGQMVTVNLNDVIQVLVDAFDDAGNTRTYTLGPQTVQPQ